MADRAIHVRLAEPRDADGIVALMQEVQAVHVAGRPDLFKPGGTENAAETRQRMLLPDSFLWVATIDSNIVGYAYGRVSVEPENRWRFAARTFILDQMGTKSGLRRRGIGRALWNAVLDVARAERTERVVLNVWSFNPGAREFYERLGFKSFHERMAVELSATPDSR
jgi:ribosomal protein S18 acetylase RimI-like enzyme